MNIEHQKILLKAKSMADKQKFVESISELKKLLPFEELNHIAYNNIGYILHTQKKYNDAIENYNKSLNIKNDSQVCFNCGLSYLKLQDENNAKVFFEKSIETNPNNIKSLTKLEELISE